MTSGLCWFSVFTVFPFPHLLTSCFCFFLNLFSKARWRAEGGAGCEGLAVAQSAQHEALCRSEPLHPHTGQREGGARISGTQGRRWPVGELQAAQTGSLYHLTAVMFHVNVPAHKSHEYILSCTHHTKIHHPFKPNTHPVTRPALPHPLHVFHNFISSSFSHMMPQDSVVSRGNPIMTSLNYTTFICPLGPWESIFGVPLQSADCCAFAFVFVHASPLAWSTESHTMMSSLRKAP